MTDGALEEYGLLGIELAAVAAGVVVAAGASTLPAGSPVRFVLVAPLLLFLPGYALTTALFPRSEEEVWTVSRARADDDRRTIGGVERAALSVGLSVALMPVFGLAFSSTTGLGDASIVPAAAAVVVAAALVGAARRARLPAHERYEVPLGRWAGSARYGVAGSSASDALVNVLLAASILVAVGALAVGFAVPQQAADPTEFAVGTETETGEFQTADYPTELTAGESAEVSVLVQNERDRTVEYTVVVQAQRVEDGRVVQRTNLDQFSVQLGPGERTVQTHTVAPTTTGDVRVTYLLYAGDPPAVPDRDSAYRSVHFWTEVSE